MVAQMREGEALDQVISQQIDQELARLEPLADHDKLGVPHGAPHDTVHAALAVMAKDLQPSCFQQVSGDTQRKAARLLKMLEGAAARLQGDDDAEATAEQKAIIPEERPTEPPPAGAATLPQLPTMTPYQSNPQMQAQPWASAFVQPQMTPTYPLPAVPTAPAYGYGVPADQEVAMLRMRADAAERMVAELQMQVAQLGQQLQVVAHRADTAERALTQFRGRAEAAERLALRQAQALKAQA